MILIIETIDFSNFRTENSLNNIFYITTGYIFDLISFECFFEGNLNFPNKIN